MAAAPRTTPTNYSRIGLALIAAAVLFPATARAEPAKEMVFSRLGNESGLSQGAVLAITHDSKGFLWFGTEDGLNRFDGYELLHLVRDRKNPASLPNNWVSALANHADGRLFIGTDGGGVVWRDPVTGRFQVPASPKGEPLVPIDENVRALHVDASGHLWVGTRKSGLIRVDLARKSARTLRSTAHDNQTISDDAITALAEDSTGQIWVGTRNGLNRVDLDGSKVTRFTERLRALTSEPGVTQINDLHVEARGFVWVATNAGLVSFDPASDRMQVHRPEANNPRTLPDRRVMALLEDDEQRLWVGTTAGLALFDRRTGLSMNFKRDPADTASLPDNNIVTLHQGPSGLLWVGTKSGGLARWNPRSWSFGHHRLADPEANNITSFAEDRRGRLWIGTFGAGLYSVERRTGVTTKFGGTGTRGSPLGDDNVMALVADERDRLWVGTMSAGVIRIDQRTGTTKQFAPNPDDENSLGAPGIMSLMEDSRGRVWVGTFGAGIARIDPDSDRVTRYPVSRDGSAGLSSDRATTIEEDRTGLIWVGTDGGGLSVLDPSSGEFRHYRHAPKDPESLSANTVYSIHVDDRGEVWIGTRGGGLDRAIGSPFSARGLVFENYSEAQGLPNNTVYGVHSDASGALWLSTNRGIASLDRTARRFRPFFRSHGLQGDEFNLGAHFRSASGELLFGGANGYNAFVPERLRFNQRPPDIVLTGLLKFNAPAELGTSYDSLSQLALSHRDDVITFQFAALDFTAPGQNRYAYKLEGFDNDWVEADKTRQATYTNLSGGNYVFRVRAANSDGVWNETGLAIPVIVEAPPWARWWAYILYVAALLLMMYTVWAQQQKKVLREASYARRLQAEVEERTRELAERNSQLERANNQLQEASVTDPMTGLGNRRYLYNTVNALLEPDAAGRVTTQRLVLMVIDLDRLKPINDQFGHEAGDRVIVQIGELLKHVSRSTDLVVRWGGDEFVVVCRDADMMIAGQLAERIRSTVAKQLFRVGAGRAARTSCSIGFAPYPFIPEFPEHTTWEQSLALADAALYQSKRSRNSWVGLAGKPKAVQLPQLVQAIESDALQLEQDGYIDVHRRPVETEDTVDRILALGSPGV